DAGVTKRVFGTPESELLEPRASGECLRITIGGLGDLSDLRRDSTGVIFRREPGHRRDARSPGKQVRFDHIELEAEWSCGSHTRDPNGLIPVHEASSWADWPFD